MELLFGVLLRLSLSFSAHAEFIAMLAGVSDDDTLTVPRDKKKVKIRLSGIEAPEKARTFGRIPKRELRDNFALPPDL
jgi:endonuclease YncB( thermonuclease family)